MRYFAGFMVWMMLCHLIACDSTPKKPKPQFTKTIKLIEYGIPVTLNAPEDAKVTNHSDNLMQDVLIEGDHYYVQIYGTSATTPDCKNLAQEALTDYKTTSSTFKEVVQQDDCGFIYSVQTERDTNTYYNFDYYSVKGNKTYRFTTTSGPLVDLDQQQVTFIYEAVKAQE